MYNLKSFRISIPAASVQGVLEWTPSTSVFTNLIALHVMPINSVIGDTVSVETYVGETKVGEYAKDTHIINTPCIVSFDRQNPMDVPATIKIKFIYDAVDDNGREFILWVRFQQ